MQPSFFDTPEPQTDFVQDRPRAAIAPSADRTARHCSSMGALKAEETRETIWLRMIAIYQAEPRTDAEIAALLSGELGRVVAPSTISARRQELIRQGLLESQSCGTRKNEATGVSNSLWQVKATQ